MWPRWHHVPRYPLAGRVDVVVARVGMPDRRGAKGLISIRSLCVDAPLDSVVTTGSILVIAH